MRSRKIEKEKQLFYFVFQKKMGKITTSPLTVIFLNLKDQKCLFQFDFCFLNFPSNGINPGARRLILNFNFHHWMKIKWTKGTRTNNPS